MGGSLVIAVVDETSPEVNGGILYGVISAVVISDEVSAGEALEQILPDGRRRPFHWNEEGPQAREAMRRCIGSLGVVGRAVVVQCGRRSQERARRTALADTIDHLMGEGCDRLMIESRTSAQDGRDKKVILDQLRQSGNARRLDYSWHTKDEPLIWIADAVSGVVREHLIGSDPAWYEAISEVTDLAIEYRAI